MFSSAPVTALFCLPGPAKGSAGSFTDLAILWVFTAPFTISLAVLPLNPGLWSDPRRVPKVTISALPSPFTLLPKPQGRTAAVAVPKVTIAPTTVRDTQSHKMLFLTRLWAWADGCFSFGSVDWL